MPTVIGIDLGGTKIAGARFDAKTWEQQESARMETHADKGFAHVCDDVIQMIEELRTDDTQGVGIGVPGLINQPDGSVQVTPNIPGSEGFPLKVEVTARVNLHTEVDNDVNCFALAESQLGAGKGHSVLVGIALGTGVGGGIIIDNKVFQGANGYAAEIGHMLLVPGQPPYDTDDKRGEVEQFFSGTAMGKRCEQASSPDEYLEGAVCSFMHKSIFQEIAWMCTNIIHVLDPSIIIFGGSAGHALAPHFKSVQEELRKWMLPGTPVPELKLAELKNAGTVGAALLTL